MCCFAACRAVFVVLVSNGACGVGLQDVHVIVELKTVELAWVSGV